MDLLLPGLSGGELLAEIRRTSSVPVIVLSAKTELSDKVGLLSSGADDYLTKPCQLEELWARILVQLRHASAAPAGEILRFRDWALNFDEMTLTAAGRVLAGAGISVEEMGLHRQDLEGYFLERMGGENHV